MTSTTRKTATANPYKLPPSLLTAMAALGAALDARTQSDGAITRNGEALAAAEAERPKLAKTLDDFDVELAMETDAKRAEGLEDAAEDARNAVADADRKVARLARVQQALIDKATAADVAIAEARAVLKAEREAFGRECCEMLDAELATALTALAPALARAHALREAGLLGWGAPLLQDTTIPGPNHAAGNLLRGGRMRLPSGETVDLASNWRQFADQAARDLVEGELVALDRRAAAHRAFVPPAKTAAPAYQPNLQNLRAAELNRAIEQREAARVAANPAKPWHGQSWRGNVA
jgi:hypothetical protein